MVDRKVKLTKSQDKILTDIISQMEQVEGSWELPWHELGLQGNPINIIGGKPYRGFNRLVLMLKQAESGFRSPVWGTLRQWNRRRSKVILGEKATTLLYPVFRLNKKGEDQVAFFRPFWVFNGEQVSNYNPDHPSLFADDEVVETNTISELEVLIEKHAIEIDFNGDRACYYRVKDMIEMPLRSSFIGTSTSTAEESFYATLLHEVVHWTGHETRLDRPAHDQRGDDIYAFEELVAEIGSAFLCGDFKITNSPREDHAKYLASWLRVLKDDKSQLWKAASKAQHAVDYFTGYSTAPPPQDFERPPAFSLELQSFQPDLFTS